MARIHVEVAPLYSEEPPLYQRIAARASHLHVLGLSNVAIARRIGVNDKTVVKALSWIREAGQ